MMLLWLAQASSKAPQRSQGVDWQEVSRQMRDGGDSFANTELFFAALALLMVAVALMWFTRWSQQRKLRSKPLLTFHRVANELRLTLKDQWLLACVARNQSLPNPITLLISPATFDHYTAAFIAPLGAHRRSRVRQRLARLHTTLFGK